MRKISISPSILSANLNYLPSELALARDAGADYIHLDVMDGKFVPNTTLSVEIVKQICPISKMINDVHIMVEEPWIIGEQYASVGADIVTFHLEACPNDEKVLETINNIRKYNCKVGISIKPNTEVTVLDKYLDKIDLVLVMSVEPGKGGQSFLPSAIDKIKYLREKIDNKGSQCLIEVDGGINGETSKYVKDAGVDILVAGSYLYGHDDFIERAKSLLAND